MVCVIHEQADARKIDCTREGGVKITVNGELMELEKEITVPQLLEQFKLKPELVVVELNLNILKREQLTSKILQEGDQVEIVHFVGGGAEDVSPAPASPSMHRSSRPSEARLTRASGRARPAFSSKDQTKRDTVPARPTDRALMDLPVAGPKSSAKKSLKIKKASMKNKSEKMSGALVIVESPTKAKTLNRFLGSAYKVIASQGHVMDLPASQFGVDLEHDFAPKYIVIMKKRKIVKELKLAAAKYKELYLATDPDREGEAISAHLATLLGKGKKVYRAVFHEITPAAVQAAFEHPQLIDEHKVEAQQARRILDRILGYSLSPLLWKKVGRGLSAGRVQSVALRLIVDRERAIRAFVPVEYWQILATLEKLKKNPPAPASGSQVGPGNEPTGFSAMLETIDTKKAEIKTGDVAQSIVEELKGLAFIVENVTQKASQRHPSAPFTTSTLQQAAFNRLGFTAARTMRIAQQLYEGIEVGAEGPVGLITYMRTDSVQIAAEARAQASQFIQKQFGNSFLPETPRIYRSRRGAQEAHEAIRPTSVFRTPESIAGSLSPEQLKLYTLIWNRFIASQMASARLEVTSIEIAAGRFGFRASGTKILFPGFLQIMKSDEESETPPAVASQFLPTVVKAEKLKTISIDPSQHFTKPPARFTEASLIRTMEELGIGRPSTYAPTIQTISTRGYVNRQGRALIPSDLGEIVTDLLLQHFPKVLDVQFTARMEENLDEVEEGKQPWNSCVKEFYEPFAEALKTAATEMQSVKQAPVPIDETCPQCGKTLVIKWGRNGKFISCSGFPECRFAKPITTGVKCPEPGCEGELVQRRSRRGIFYGCSKFPACRHIERQLPITKSQLPDSNQSENPNDQTKD